MRYILMGTRHSIAGTYDLPVAYFTTKEKAEQYLLKYPYVVINGARVFHRDSVLSGFDDCSIVPTTRPFPPIDPE
jgi:hypothetical protein